MFESSIKVTIKMSNGDSFDMLTSKESLTEILNVVKTDMNNESSTRAGYIQIVSTDNGITKNRLVRVSAIDEVIY